MLAASYYVTNNGLKYILIALGIAGALLLLGLLLRSKVKIFQKIFLPASVIGGFVGLILGPEVFGLIPVVGDWMVSAEGASPTILENVVNIWSLLPGILIIPIFAATPLGLFSKKKTKEEKIALKKEKAGKKNIALGLFFMLMGMMVVQIVVGLLTNLACKGFTDNMYNTFGFELAVGYVGGHGSVGSIPALFGQYLGQETALVSQGVGTAFATFGLVGGTIFGIIFINIAARKGKTSVMKEPVKLEGVALTGLVKNIEEQQSIGRETTKNYTIESITVIIGIICADCALAYGVVKGLSLIPKVGSILGQIPVWSLAMLFMFGINKLLQVLKLEWLIDRKLVARITGAMTDFAIVCAIASMPVSAVMTYIVPILIACIVGYVITFLYVFFFTKFVCGKDAPFEHSIIGWGTCTGVMMTGLMLLKICDPNYETPALNNFSKGFAFMSVLQVVLLVVYGSFFTKPTWMILVISIGFTVIFTAGALVVGFLNRKKGKKVAAVQEVAAKE